MIDFINAKYFKYAVGANIGVEKPTDISAKCILCGDSSNDPKLKRLHIYTKVDYDGDIVHCFNCGFKNNMYSFLQQPAVNPTLYEQYVKEKRELNFNALKTKAKEKNEFSEAVVDIGFTYNPSNPSNPTTSTGTGEANIEGPSEPESKTNSEKTQPSENSNGPILFEGKEIPPKVFILPREFVTAGSNAEALDYLTNRRVNSDGLFYSTDWLEFEGKRMPLKDSIIIPLWVSEPDGICYGFQARSIREKFFYTFIPEENTGWKVWNWFGIERDKPVFVFESVFDALSSGLPSNRISAALGADLSPERELEVKEAIMCYDNQRCDHTAYTKSIELLNKQKRVFIWPTEIKEKDSNSWLKNHPESSSKEFASIILNNLHNDMKGIMRLKLKR